MNEEKETEKSEKIQVEIRDFADEQQSDDSIDLSKEDKALDDQTIDDAKEEDESTSSETHENDTDVEKETEIKVSSDNEADTEIASMVDEDGAVDEVADEEASADNELGDTDIDEADNSEKGKHDHTEEKVEDLEDEQLNVAVDDIVREESDDVLELDDAIKEPEEPQPSGLKKIVTNIKHGFSWWWHRSIIRNTSLAVFMLSIIATAMFPVTRYAVLNTFGVRVQSSMRIIDSETLLPLQNIRVSLQGTENRTDSNGEVSFSELKLGDSDLVISRRGYAENRQTIVLGLGSNPLGEKAIVATGLQYTFELSDWISDAPVTQALASSGEFSAKANEQGIIVLTLSEDSEEDTEITIQTEGYRDERFIADQLQLEDKNTVYLVNDRKHVFVSNRDSRYDVFSVDLDGKNESLLIEGTGKEREIPQLFAHPAQQYWALISSYEGETNKDNYVVDGLYLINTKEGEPKRIARSERIQVVGWSGDYIVFWLVVEGTSQGNPERSKLYSYNIQTGERVELAAANYFNDVELVNSVVYYAVSGFAVPESYARLFQVNINGEQKIQVLNKQVYAIFRTGIDALLYSAANQEWFEQLLPESPQPTERRSNVPDNYSYIVSSSDESIAWVRVRDGQGVLQYRSLNSEDETSKDLEATVDAGIREVLYWLGDKAIVYRIVKSGETADYVVSLGERPDGSERISKISNITVQTFNGY